MLNKQGLSWLPRNDILNSTWAGRCE